VDGLAGQDRGPLVGHAGRAGPGEPRQELHGRPGRLRQSIAEALSQGAPSASERAAPRSARPPTATPTSVTSLGGGRGERRDRHECSKCRKAYVIVYESEAGEPTETVPVACPRCWQIDHVAVAQSAGINSDYRVLTVD
jgi:hypothetical protein